MEPIHSGTTAGRIARTLLMMILVCGWSAWSLVDGYVRYPKANVESVLRTRLGIEPPDPLPVIDSELTEERASEIKEQEPFDAVASRLGGGPFRHDGAVYYFGYGGSVRLEVKHGRVASRQWIDGPNHTATDLLIQKVIGFGLIPVGLAFIVQFVRVVTTRVSLTDAGLKVRGKPLIPLEAITGVRTGKARGVATVDYTLNDRAATIRLDDYVVKEQAAIVTAICQRKGFDNPNATSAQS